MEQAEHAFAGRNRYRVAPAQGAEDARSAPIRRESSLGCRQQDEHDRRRRRADVFLVLKELSGECRRGDDERRRPLELRRLRGARALLERRERVRAEHAEAPRLGEVMVRREAGDAEQVEQDLARYRLRAGMPVRSARVRQLGPAPASPPPARRRPPGGRAGAPPACVSSLAGAMGMQPPCAPASSSSGLVLPSAWPIRVGSENGSSLNAPDVTALIAPAPRATFP